MVSLKDQAFLQEENYLDFDSKDRSLVLGSDLFLKLSLSFKKGVLFPAIIFESSYLPQVDSFCWFLSQMIYCQDHSGCGRCHGCRLFEVGRNSDFLLISSKTSLKVEDTKKVMDHFSIGASANSYRVVFIQNADTMSISSMNSLLKILEELPPRCYCFMGVKSREVLLPTILSRCMCINLRHISDPDFEKIYPYLTQDLMQMVTQRITQLLCGSYKKEDDFLEPMFVECSKLNSRQVYELIHLGLNKVLKSGSMSGIDSQRLDVLMDRVKKLHDGLRLSSSINSRLALEGCLL